MEALKEIEDKLVNLVEIDKRNWTQFYLLLKKVEDHELWKTENKSFTAWIKNFSKKHKIHETIIWNRKKAGKVYETYARVKAEKGEEVQDISEINVSPENLILLDKINQHDPVMASKLVDKVLTKTIKGKDLREVYKSIRPEKLDKTSYIPHYRREVISDIEDIGDIEDNEDNDKIRANDIVAAICNAEWLGKKQQRRFYKTSYENNKHRTFTEFPVYTGTSKHSRRIDALIVENITTDELWELHLHAIEIKVSKSDLANDTKYTEYAEFVDYLWLAIPEELLEVAINTKPDGCGIITVKNNKALIVEQAKKLDSYRRIETLTSIALKTI